MIHSFLEGFILGIGAAVPLGPINILIMNNAIKEYKNGVSIGFGAMSADILYLCLILFGFMHFLATPIIMDFLAVIGSIFLLYMAYIIFKNRDKNIKQESENIKKESLLKLYLSGFTLTMLSPYTIAFWLSIGTYASSSNINPIVTILGLLSAIFMWITLMPYFIHKTKHIISHNISRNIAIISAIILGGFGLSMFIKTFLI